MHEQLLKFNSPLPFSSVFLLAPRRPYLDQHQRLFAHFQRLSYVFVPVLLPPLAQYHVGVCIPVLRLNWKLQPMIARAESINVRANTDSFLSNKNVINFN